MKFDSDRNDKDEKKKQDTNQPEKEEKETEDPRPMYEGDVPIFG